MIHVHVDQERNTSSAAEESEQYKYSKKPRRMIDESFSEASFISVRIYMGIFAQEKEENGLNCVQ